MRVGYIQFEPRLGEIDRNIERSIELVALAQDADLLVLPELSNSGYAFSSFEEAETLAEEIPDGNTIRAWADVAWQKNLYLVGGINEKTDGKLYNSSVLIGPQGYLGTYRKAHLFKNEKLYFVPGDLGFPVFNLNDIKVGMLICFDWSFPEAWRTLALNGVDIICHPSNFVLTGLAQSTLPVHALLNRIFIVTANRIGTERDLTFSGRSLICSPGGEVLAESPADKEDVVTIDIDPLQARNKMITEKNHLFEDRRPQLYAR